MAGFSMHRHDRTATSGKTRGGGPCRYVNNNWCTKSNIKEVSTFCSSEVEYLKISCRPHYIPREFSSIFFVAVYLPPQTDAGTKTALKQLYKAISKKLNSHPDAALRVAGDFDAGKLKSVQPEEKNNSRTPLLHTQRREQSSPSPSICQI